LNTSNVKIQIHKFPKDYCLLKATHWSNTHLPDCMPSHTRRH